MTAVAEVLLGESVTSLAAIWDDVAPFLGYAPVLAVLAETIPSDNPFRDAVSGTGKNTASEVLLTLMHALLVREQKKFVVNTGPRLMSKLPATAPFSQEQLYSPEDQLYRLACAAHPDQGMIDRRVVPDIIWPDYDESAQQWVADHPFGGTARGAVNTVFADYVSASAALDPTSSTPRTADPGPFFHRFVFALCPPEASLSESVIAPLVSSVLKSTTSVHTAWFLTQVEGQAEIEVFDYYSNEFVARKISDLSGIIELAAPLSLGFVVTDEAVLISGQSGAASLGPRLVVSAQHVTTDVDSLSVSHGDVHVFATEIDASKLRNVNVYDPARFYVLGGSEWPLLRQYASPPQHWGNGGFVNVRSYVDLRAVLRGFSRRAAGVLSIYVDKLDQGIVKQSRRRRHMLDRLIELSVVTVEDKHYVLDADRFAEYGVSLPSLVGGEPDAAVMRLIRKLEEGFSADANGAD